MATVLRYYLWSWASECGACICPEVYTRLLAAGRNTGQGYVVLGTPEEVAKAIEECNRQNVGNRYIE